MTNLNYITALLVIVILFHGCHTVDGSNVSNKQEIHLKDRALHYWDKRVNKNDAEKALYFLSKYHSVKPDDLDIAILYSRACYFNGYYIEKKSAKQDSLYLEGYQIAIKIIYNSNPRIRGKLTQLVFSFVRVEHPLNLMFILIKKDRERRKKENQFYVDLLFTFT